MALLYQTPFRRMLVVEFKLGITGTTLAHAMLTVSIVIRTYGVERLPAIFDAISSQASGPYSLSEIVVVNGAPHLRVEADTLKLNTEWPVVIVQNPHFPYRPGQALNFGIRHTTGSVIAFLSGHSVPASSDWLNSLLKPMQSDQVAGVCGRQLPFEDSNAVERLYRRVWYGSRTLAKAFRHFNLANAAIRRQYWERLPFDEVLEGCEDRHWSRLTQERFGVNFEFSREAASYHSHIVSYRASCRYFGWLILVYMRALSRRDFS